MVRHPIFSLYCFATWWIVMYEPAFGLDLLWFGAAIFILHRERQAATVNKKAARAL